MSAALRLTRVGECRYVVQGHIPGGGLVRLRKLATSELPSSGKCWIGTYFAPGATEDTGEQIAESWSFKMLKLMVRRWIEARV